jgi:hypothetical protein
MNKKHVIGYPVAVILALTIGAAGASGSSTATVASLATPTTTVTVAGPVITETVAGPETTVVAEAPAPAPVVSTCDKAREAILTGTPTGITAAMNALVADKSAPAIAREYARYYTVRDKDSKDLREMDESLIQMSCS